MFAYNSDELKNWCNTLKNKGFSEEDNIYIKIIITLLLLIMMIGFLVLCGKKPEKVQRDANGKLKCTLSPQLELSMPIMFSAMSYGSISYNAHASLARAAVLCFLACFAPRV